jgi:hypothetical protein
MCRPLTKQCRYVSMTSHQLADNCQICALQRVAADKLAQDPELVLPEPCAAKGMPNPMAMPQDLVGWIGLWLALLGSVGWAPVGWVSYLGTAALWRDRASCFCLVSPLCFVQDSMALAVVALRVASQS